MISKLYKLLLKILSKPEERGQPSAGIWQGRIREIAFRLLKEDYDRILEVGCGEGLFLKKLKDLGITKATGIDISLKQLKKAIDKCKDFNFIQADATSLPFKDKSFKNIVCINFFLNLPSEKVVDKVLEEIRRISCQEAKFIFEIRNSLSPLIFLKYKTAKYYDNTIKNLITFRYEDFKKKLEALKFKVIKKINLGFPNERLAPIIIIEAIKYD